MKSLAHFSSLQLYTGQFDKCKVGLSFKFETIFVPILDLSIVQTQRGL